MSKYEVTLDFHSQYSFQALKSIEYDANSEELESIPTKVNNYFKTRSVNDVRLYCIATVRNNVGNCVEKRGFYESR